MHDLQPLTALGDSEARIDTIGVLTITEVPDVALASVAARLGQEAACAASLKELIGVTAPAPGQATLTDKISAIWMGPDQWMLMSSHTGHEDLARHVTAQITGASVTEQNDAWVCFDVTGQSVAAMFERLCPVPVKRLATDAAQRTTIDHLGCFVIVTETNRSVRVLGPRSSAASLHHALVTAAMSVN